MIDLHTHTIFSDGVLIPSELIRRFEILDYSAVAITDHADPSNFDFIIPRIIHVAEELNTVQPVKVIPGIELTHIPPKIISQYVEKARSLGAELIIIHGESIVEPVAPGTNLAGIDSGADILAHPGLITHEEASLAAENKVYLEITSRNGHSYANGHVAKIAMDTGAKLILNSDSHSPGDLMTKEFAAKVIEGSGLSADSLSVLLSNSSRLLERIGYPV